MLPKYVSRFALRGLLVSCAFPATAFAQNIASQSRISQAVDEANIRILRGNTHPLAQARFDQGAAPDSLPLERMFLVLKRSAAQEAALDALLDQQQDSTSPNYHQWITPQQFGRQFGPSDQDIQTITTWLQSHGFRIAGVSNGRTVIEFSGNAGQVRQALHTEIHRYTVNGQDHWANSSDPQIPAALLPVVAGINTLYNFPRQAMHEVAGTFTRSRGTGRLESFGSQFTITSGGNEALAVAPADFAKIYNVPNLTLNPAPATQYNGDGQTIAIVGESDINLKDVIDFRTLFGLPLPGKLTTIVSGPDPGITGAETEGDLDIEWAGAVAPNAMIDYVIADSTDVSLGVDLAAQYAVDNNLAPVLNESYGVCEFVMGTAGNAFYNQLWQQASAEGITVTVSSGDGGSAACDQGARIQGAAQYGLTVSGFTSTPYNISVGGTDFNDTASFQSYWNLTPSDTPTIATALGYIPEMTWNDTCTNQEIFAHFGVASAEASCNNSTEASDGYVSVAAAGGGQSNCTVSDAKQEASCSGGYPKPLWQSGSGVPNDGKRDVPDVSLFSSNGFNYSFYVVCESDISPGIPSCDPFAAGSEFLGAGGTSVSSVAFGAIMTLVNQATGTRQGNANYILYRLASQSGNTCTSAANPSSACVFYDTPTGSTISVPCASGSPDRPGQSSSTCPIEFSGDTIGVLSGYDTTQGYDSATGLGSVNAANLISKWKSFDSAQTASTTTLNLNNGSAVNIIHGQSIPISIAVTGSGGTPTGTVSLIANTGTNAEQGVASAALVNGSATFSTSSLPGGANYTVFAQYSGDGTFKPSTSATTVVTITPEQSKAAVTYELFDPVTGAQTNPNATTANFGAPSLLRINVTNQSGNTCPQNSTGNSGCPTGTLTVTDNGNPLDGGLFGLNAQGYAEDQIISLFSGTHQINAVYPGDSSFASSSASDFITIGKVPTVITVSTVSTVWDGGETQLTATVTTNSYATNKADLPTGTIEIALDGGTVFQSPLAVSSQINSQNGTAEALIAIDFASSSVPPGPHTFTAQYSGDANYAGATATNPLSVTVTSPTSTAVALSSPGQNSTNVIITARIGWPTWRYPTPTMPVPTGMVQFNLSSATGMSLGSAAVSNGQAQITVLAASIPSGTAVYATYSGDANYVTSTGSASQTSILLNTTLTVIPTSTSPTAGNPVTFTAQVTPAPGGPPLTGSVTFLAMSPFNFNISDVKPLSNGQAQGNLSLWTGSDTVFVTYPGDSNYASSAATIIENVTGIGTATTLSSSNPSSHVGDTIAFTASVSATQSGSPQPNGSAFFFANGVLIGNAALSNGQSVLSNSSLAAGTYAITVTYGPDLYHSSSTASTSQTVLPGASTTIVTSSSPSVAQGSLVTVTAQVNPTNIGYFLPAPSGAVQFSSNGVAIGFVRLSSGKAQISTVSLPLGANAINASYTGDSNYTASAGTMTETITPAQTPSFSISANPTALTIPAPGQSISTTLTFTSQGNLAGSGGLISPTCGTSSAEEITCSLTAFNLPANGTAQATLTFNSMAASQSPLNLRNTPVVPATNAARSLLLGIACVLAVLVFAQRRNHVRWNLIFGVILVAILATTVSCGGGGGNSGGGGSGGGGGGGPTNPGTPLGAVQPLSVSINIGGIAQTVPNLTVTVQ